MELSMIILAVKMLMQKNATIAILMGLMILIAVKMLMQKNAIVVILMM
jgi:hypothetical protein